MMCLEAASGKGGDTPEINQLGAPVGPAPVSFTYYTWRRQPVKPNVGPGMSGGKMGTTPSPCGNATRITFDQINEHGSQGRSGPL